ncbi:MAG: ABC transporter permease [Bacteroidales bacterium]
MFRNLLKTAWRNIRKSFLYSLLNVLGLSLAITGALFLIIYVTDEMSYDRYHDKAGRIYRVQSHIKETDDEFTWIYAQIPFATQVVTDYPDVEGACRFINFNRALFKYEGREFIEEDFYYADTTVFDIFTYRFIYGNPATALSRPDDLVLTETVARKYFGKENPLGKALVSGERSYNITGVIRDVPDNSHFRFDALVSRLSLPQEMGTWGNFGVFTYLLFPENVNVADFEVKLQEMYAKYMAPIFESIGISIRYELMPIRRIHLYSDNAGEPEPTGSIMYVYIFGLVAFILILIAALNYMNLATARSARRAREVGLRKVVGSGRGALVAQFLTESVTLTVLSLLISCLLLILLLPAFNHLSGKGFDVSILWGPSVLVSLVGLVLLIGILGGSYPAFYLSGFSPAHVMKSESGSTKSGALLRKILVVVQFSISIAMIVCTMIVYVQLNHLRHMDQGFKMDNVICLTLPDGERPTQFTLLKHNLLKSSDIVKAGATNTRIGEGSGKVVMNIETSEGMARRGVNFTVVDHDFINALGIEMAAGRNFSEDMPSDTLLGVIVNEALATRMGWTEPLGKKVELGDANTLRAEVVGVMKDYQQTGMYNQVESLLMIYRINLNLLYVKLGDDTGKALEFVETSWTDVFPGQPFTYDFLNERFEQQFAADRNRGTVFTLFTVLAIFIACLGLFGLASFTMEKRTREIGIRKVLGASEGRIIGLVSREFFVLILVSMAIALPVSWYFMNNWLENYVYRATPGFLVFLVPVLFSFVLTALTISFHAIKAASTNPVEAINVSR